MGKEPWDAFSCLVSCDLGIEPCTLYEKRRGGRNEGRKGKGKKGGINEAGGGRKNRRKTYNNTLGSSLELT